MAEADPHRVALAELVRAGNVLLNGLNRRIDEAPDNKKPVFEGIMLFFIALAKAKQLIKERAETKS